MCHEYTRRAWNDDSGESETDSEDEDVPAFLNEEAGDDVEVLTDGGE
ncbi:MAG: hypothetical protein ABEJ40_02645 [Haloarculaceae archaeon]